MNSLTEQILIEILKECENVMWKMAHTTHIPGFDADDLMQEMRIKIWQTIKNNHYDPERVKPTSFYYRVCKNCLIDVRKSKIPNYNTTRPRNRIYRDGLDSKIDKNETELAQLGQIPTSFVQNFSEKFKNSFFGD